MAKTIDHLQSGKSQTFLAVLTGATTLVAAIALSLELTTALEAVSFVTGALCVWLVVRENVWNFPIGLLNVATFSIVFFQSRLFADAGLQVVYFVMGIVGWTLWLRGGKNHTPLNLSRIGSAELAWICVFVVVSTLGLWQTLHYLGGSASFWDALTTSLFRDGQHIRNWMHDRFAEQLANRHQRIFKRSEICSEIRRTGQHLRNREDLFATTLYCKAY